MNCMLKMKIVNAWLIPLTAKVRTVRAVANAEGRMGKTMLR